MTTKRGAQTPRDLLAAYVERVAAGDVAGIVGSVSETAVGCESFEQDVGEAGGRHAAACGDVFHFFVTWGGELRALSKILELDSRFRGNDNVPTPFMVRLLRAHHERLSIPALPGSRVTRYALARNDNPLTLPFMLRLAQRERTVGL